MMLLNKSVSGEDRFFRFEDHLKDSVLYLDISIKGFYLPTFGDGLIIANDPLAGVELMKLRLTNNEIAILPVNNNEGSRFLMDNDCKEFKRMKRMIIGEKRVWYPENIYNRAGGPMG